MWYRVNSVVFIFILNLKLKYLCSWWCLLGVGVAGWFWWICLVLLLDAVLGVGLYFCFVFGFRVCGFRLVS